MPHYNQVGLHSFYRDILLNSCFCLDYRNACVRVCGISNTNIREVLCYHDSYKLIEPTHSRYQFTAIQQSDRAN